MATFYWGNNEIIAGAWKRKLQRVSRSPVLERELDHLSHRACVSHQATVVPLPSPWFHLGSISLVASSPSVLRGIHSMTCISVSLKCFMTPRRLDVRRVQ